LSIIVIWIIAIILIEFKKATKYYPSKEVIAAQVKLKAALKLGSGFKFSRYCVTAELEMDDDSY